MTKIKQLLQRAANIGEAQRSAISGWQTELDQLEQRKIDVEQRIRVARASEERINTYGAALQSASNENPLCPDCWMEGREVSILRPTRSFGDDDVYECNRCSFEDAFTP